jgi:hypothetical protein
MPPHHRVRPILRGWRKHCFLYMRSRNTRNISRHTSYPCPGFLTAADIKGSGGATRDSGL